MAESRAAQADWRVLTSQEQSPCTVLVQEEPRQICDEEYESQEMSTADLLDRLEKARILGNDDKLLIAERLLRGVDNVHLQALHFDILREAALFKSLLLDNATSLDGWVQQGKHTGRHNFSIYYKLNESAHGRDLSCRLETVIPSDLLVPIISVLNESELYSSWLPNWTAPKLHVVTSEKLQQTGRCSQIVNVVIEVPWPLAKRQVILKAVACDDIDSHPNEGDGNANGCQRGSGGRIIIRIQSLDANNKEKEGWEIPPTDNDAVQVKVHGGFTIEKCPADHPMKEYALQYLERIEKSVSSPSRVDLVLVTFSFCVDPQLAGVPKPFIDFFVRYAIGKMWNKFLDVAEEVKNGERNGHSDAIATKRALYDWVEERTRVMLEQI
ncbi:hypothetical protein ACHAXA_010003 [Cyclostephanos tholiformis]|uniref:Uncharacterized protein n=1 Tax=Cyclostephanos tholiformis TaxID=382380 RepID=A0ABD3RU64_9STRA